MNPSVSTPSDRNPVELDRGADAGAAQRAWLSALADGQADALEPACHAFGTDPEARATWHRYQLIGDVLRSSELASVQPASDARFLHGLRERLATEPAVLAPAPLPAPATPLSDSRREAALSTSTGRRPQRWVLPVAAAAGVAVVAGMVAVGGVGVGTGGRGAGAPSLAQADTNAPMLRSAEIDEYLRAHRLQRGAVVPMMPGSGLQQTELSLSPLNLGPAGVRPQSVPRAASVPVADGRR